MRPVDKVGWQHMFIEIIKHGYVILAAPLDLSWQVRRTTDRVPFDLCVCAFCPGIGTSTSQPVQFLYMCADQSVHLPYRTKRAHWTFWTSSKQADEAPQTKGCLDFQYILHRPARAISTDQSDLYTMVAETSTDPVRAKFPTSLKSWTYHRPAVHLQVNMEEPQAQTAVDLRGEYGKSSYSGDTATCINYKNSVWTQTHMGISTDYVQKPYGTLNLCFV